MWSKNDQLAAVLDDRAEFVTRLSSDPKFVVMGIEKRDNPLVLPSSVTNMDLAADCGGTPESILDIPGEEGMRYQPPIIAAGDDVVEGDDAIRNEIRRCFDQLAGRCLNLADRVFNAGERAEPVSGVG
jgi:hypothetical protein